MNVPRDDLSQGYIHRLLIISILTLGFLSAIFEFDCQSVKAIGEVKNNCQQMKQANQRQKKVLDMCLDASFNLRLGQIANIKSEKFKITFLDVVEDSRCPADIDCYEAGQIKIAVKVVATDRDLGKIDLINNASRENLGIQQVDKYLIKFVKANPYPKSTQKIKISDYVITLIVSKMNYP
jgi:hypothetical protein